MVNRKQYLASREKLLKALRNPKKGNSTRLRKDINIVSKFQKLNFG